LNEPAKLFENCQRELIRLADLIRANPTLEDASEVESLTGGAVLGAAFIAWLKDTEETVEVAKNVTVKRNRRVRVSARVCRGISKDAREIFVRGCIAPL